MFHNLLLQTSLPELPFDFAAFAEQAFVMLSDILIPIVPIVIFLALALYGIRGIRDAIADRHDNTPKEWRQHSDALYKYFEDNRERFEQHEHVGVPDWVDQRAEVETEIRKILATEHKDDLQRTAREEIERRQLTYDNNPFA